MAFTTPITNTGARSSNSNSVTTSSVDTTGATLLVLCVQDYAVESLLTPTDSKSNTWTQRGTYNNGVARVTVWDCIAGTVGSGHTFSYGNSTARYPSIVMQAWSGNAASPFDQINGSSGNGTSGSPGSITPSENDCLVITTLNIQAETSDPTYPSGYTGTNREYNNGGLAFGYGMAYVVQTTATATNPSWSWASGPNNNWATVVLSYKSAGGGGVVRFLTLLGVG